MWSRCAGGRRGRILGAASLLLAAPPLVALLSAPGPAAAGTLGAAPVNLAPPKVFGRPAVGNVLTGFPGAWSSELPLQLAYQWRRCAVAGPCLDVPGSSSLAYFPGAADVGRRIVLRVSATSGGATEVRDSVPTDVVPGGPASDPPAPPPPPPPPPAPPAPAPASAAVLERMIEPFPVVRIRGWFSMRWTAFTLVTVRAPLGAAITMACTGRGCAFRDRRRIVSGRPLVRITGLERKLAPGTRLVLRVTMPGRIGKYTRILVRRGRRPARWDGCVMPGSVEPVPCPLA
jgi:hypothetical protein